MSLIGKLGTQVADIKLWGQDLASTDLSGMELDAFKEWVVMQLRDNLAPLMEAEARALSAELGDVHEGMNELSDVVDELIEHEDSFLRPETAKQFSEVIMLGMELCGLVEDYDPTNELSKRKLGGVMKKYKQQALVALDEIEQIVADDQDTDEEDEDAGELHEQGEHPAGSDAGGESEIGNNGSTGDGEETTPTGGE